MYPQQLIGKRAIRTKHATYAHGVICRSFMEEPITIKAVVQDGSGGGHIVYDWSFSAINEVHENYILPYEYLDNNWTDYDALIAKANRPVRKRNIRRNVPNNRRR